jgi:hypothetical protein
MVEEMIERCRTSVESGLTWTLYDAPIRNAEEDRMSDQNMEEDCVANRFRPEGSYGLASW